MEWVGKLGKPGPRGCGNTDGAGKRGRLPKKAEQNLEAPRQNFKSFKYYNVILDNKVLIRPNRTPKI